MRKLGDLTERGTVRIKIRQPTQEEWELAFLSSVVAAKNNCIVWIRARNSDGYGLATSIFSRKKELAHRISYQLFTGNQPGKLNVCHTCDNPPCINPNHLFLGTQKQNMQGASERKRFKDRIGEKHPRSTVTEVQVKEMRRLAKDGDLTHQQIADRLSTTKYIVDNVMAFKSWKHIL